MASAVRGGGIVVSGRGAVELAVVAEGRLRLCRQLLAERKIIGRYLRTNKWTHPGWIVLLELYLADAEGKLLSVSSLGHAGGVSITTAIRLMADYDKRGLVQSMRDPHDARRTLIAMRPFARASMHCILDECARLRKVER